MYGALRDEMASGLCNGTTFGIRERSKTSFVHGRTKPFSARTQAVEFDLRFPEQTYTQKSGTDLGIKV